MTKGRAAMTIHRMHSSPSRATLLLASAWLLAGACANPEKAKPPPSAPAVQLALRNARCVLLAKVLPLEEVASTCARTADGVEEIELPKGAATEGVRCAYRVGGARGGRVEIAFMGPAEAAGLRLRAELAPTAPRITPALGPHGLAFYNTARNAFFFDIRGEGVRVSARSVACEAGPLTRIVSALRDRLGGNARMPATAPAPTK